MTIPTANPDAHYKELRYLIVEWYREANSLSAHISREQVDELCTIVEHWMSEAPRKPGCHACQPDVYKACAECDGAGYLCEPYDGPDKLDTATCDKCNGTGSVLKGAT